MISSSPSTFSTQNSLPLYGNPQPPSSFFSSSLVSFPTQNCTPPSLAPLLLLFSLAPFLTQSRPPPPINPLLLLVFFTLFPTPKIKLPSYQPLLSSSSSFLDHSRAKNALPSLTPSSSSSSSFSYLLRFLDPKQPAPDRAQLLLYSFPFFPTQNRSLFFFPKPFPTKNCPSPYQSPDFFSLISCAIFGINHLFLHQHLLVLLPLLLNSQKIAPQAINPFLFLLSSPALFPTKTPLPPQPFSSFLPCAHFQ